jgi:hypothetical protein
MTQTPDQPEVIDVPVGSPAYKLINAQTAELEELRSKNQRYRDAIARTLKRLGVGPDDFVDGHDPDPAFTLTAAVTALAQARQPDRPADTELANAARRVREFLDNHDEVTDCRSIIKQINHLGQDCLYASDLRLLAHRAQPDSDAVHEPRPTAAEAQEAYDQAGEIFPPMVAGAVRWSLGDGVMFDDAQAALIREVLTLAARRPQDHDGDTALAVLHRLGWDLCDTCGGRGGSITGACGDCSGIGAKEIQEDALAARPEAQSRGLHPDREDYCEHDEIERLCRDCTPVRAGEPGRGGIWSTSGLAARPEAHHDEDEKTRPKPGDEVTMRLYSDGYCRTSRVQPDGTYTGSGAVALGRGEIESVRPAGQDTEDIDTFCSDCGAAAGEPCESGCNCLPCQTGTLPQHRRPATEEHP